VLFCIINSNAESQIITTDPALPSANASVIIYYDATLGTAGLKDYTGDIYAHTGVITENSTGGTDWKYVKTGWGENTAETKLTRVSDNLYSLNISPSIRDYYGVPENEVIEKMAFVFRSSDNSKEGKGDNGSDIFAEVFESGLNVSIINPGNNLLANPGTQVEFEAASSESAELELFLNNSSVKSVSGTSLTHTFDFDTPGDFWLKVIASANEESDSDSVFIHILDGQPEEPRPDGVLDGITYIDNQTAQLVLHAPGKDHVFVVGDFNNWVPSSEYRMVNDDERWWITINDLEPGLEYAFQYLVYGENLIADPYTEKVLDPNSDKWISEETYPNLKAYPSGYTINNTSVLQTAQSSYAWKNSDYTPPSKENLVIYELLVRDFIEAHDWLTLTDTLDYFTKLGITAIEVMPFNEFEGNESWGYNPSFYLAPDKYYGPKETLQAFVDSCHGRGIAVIMDMTLNHSFSQSPLVQLYFNKSTYKVSADNPWYNVDSPNEVFSWGYDFNHESQATQAFVDRVNSYWLSEYDLDGFRFDFTKGFTNTPGDGGAYDAARITLLKRMADELWAVNPDAYVIFEHLADNSEEKVLSDYGIMLWGNTNFNYNEATMGYNDGGKSNFSWISYQKRGWSDPHLVGYMESHDEERLMFKNLAYGKSSADYSIRDLNTALARMELAGAFFFPIPGPKMIWQFGELGYDFSIDENGRVGNKPIRWDYNEVGSRKRIYQVWAALIKLKQTEPAFSTSDFTLNLTDATKRIELDHADMDVRILGNFDVEAQSINPNFSKTGTWYDFFSGESIAVDNPTLLMNLDAGEYKIFTTKKLTTPDIMASINDVSFKNNTYSVYPVPAKDELFVSTTTAIDHISVYDLNGRLVLDKNVSGLAVELNITSLNSGVFILKMENTAGWAEYSKFIKQ